MNIKLTSYCRITNNIVSLNGKTMPVEHSDTVSWLDNIYQAFGMQYLKFFKMDNLAKAGFLAAELIGNDLGWDRNEYRKDHAIICFNCSSSLDNDTVYQQTIKDKDNYYPSPSVFVYTLANIVTGEIAICNRIQGESSFYITKQFSPDVIHNTVIDAFQDNSISGILCGWVDYFENNCDVLMLYLQRNTNQNNPKLITEEMLLELYYKK